MFIADFFADVCADECTGVGDDRGEGIGVAVDAFCGGVCETVEGVISVFVGDDEGEHPFVASGAAAVDVGELHEHLVPAFFEVDLCCGAVGEVFVGEAFGGVVLSDAFAGLLPLWCGDFVAIEPNARAAAVPFAGNGACFVARAAIGVEFDECAGVLFGGGIDVGPGVGRHVVLGVVVESFDRSVPDVAEIDSGACGFARTIGCAVDVERFGDGFFADEVFGG